MKHLDLLQQLRFCEKYSINPNELLLLEIILIAQEGDDNEIVREYFTSRMCARGATIELLNGLQQSGVILKTYKIPEKGGKFDPNEVPINKNLVKDFYKASFEMGKDLWESYPQFTEINGSIVGIRSISKKFDSPEDFYRYYGKSIRWKPEIHNKIMELINWGTEQGMIKCTLANFIIDKKYEELEALQDGRLGNYNTDAVKIV